MKKIIMLVVLALIGVAAWYLWETKPKPNNEVAPVGTPAASKHSTSFNSSVDSTLNAYYALSDALVAWDSSRVEVHAGQLQGRLAHFPLNELATDTVAFSAAQATLASVRKDAAALDEAGGLEAQRRAFHTLSQNMYDLLRSVRYDKNKVYLQECPMAFNDDETGNWLSNVPSIRNPYLGTQHPKYKSGMLECGETKDSLDYASAR